MIVGLDVGFGYTKTVTGAGVDVSPSVVGEWMPGAFRLGAELDDGRDAREPEAIGLGERTYVVGERALRIAHRRFVGTQPRVDGAADVPRARPRRPPPRARRVRSRGHRRHRSPRGGRRAARRHGPPAARGCP